MLFLTAPLAISCNCTLSFEPHIPEFMSKSNHVDCLTSVDCLFPPSECWLFFFYLACSCTWTVATWMLYFLCAHCVEKQIKCHKFVFPAACWWADFWTQRSVTLSFTHRLMSHSFFISLNCLILSLQGIICSNLPRKKFQLAFCRICISALGVDILRLFSHVSLGKPPLMPLTAISAIFIQRNEPHLDCDERG